MCTIHNNKGNSTTIKGKREGFDRPTSKNLPCNKIPIAASVSASHNQVEC